MVERTALEMRRTREGTVGSNPTLSAIYSLYHRTFAVRRTAIARTRVHTAMAMPSVAA